MKNNLKKILFLTILLFGLFFSFTALAADPIVTNMQTPFPGFQQTQTITNSSFGQYVGALYKYGVALGASLAVIMLMIGGIFWLTSAGSADKIGQAKAYIGGALAGLVLLLCSYLILYTINPKLVELQSLNITPINEIKVEYKSECQWEKKGFSPPPEEDIIWEPANDNQCIGKKLDDDVCWCPKKIEKAGCCDNRQGKGWVEYKNLTGKEECLPGCSKERCFEYPNPHIHDPWYFCCLPSGAECEDDWSCCSKRCISSPESDLCA